MSKGTLSRDFIIAEIKRVADTLGHAPGKREFFANAGIKESDWSGRFWARWNDALQEAGFAPNQLRAAHSDGYLLESLIALTRELGGRFPTRPEMRLKRRRDSSFPNDKTFERFGGWSNLVQQVRAYCAEREGYSDVIDACSVAITTKPQRRADYEQNATSREEVFGYVYLIKSGRYYKVGRSNSAGRREYELSIQLPERAKLVHEIRTDDPVGIERYWHQRFAERRKNGEWFELEPGDVKAFTRRRFM